MTRKKAKIILQCRGNGYTEDEFNEALEIAYSALDSSLPSNLDEAAEEFVKITSVKVWGKIDPKKDLEGYMARSNYGVGLLDGFKAGAEWMAGQGVILNLPIDEFSCGAYNACVEQGLTSEDDVIVQIRKKQ